MCHDSLISNVITHSNLICAMTHSHVSSYLLIVSIIEVHAFVYGGGFGE